MREKWRDDSNAPIRIVERNPSCGTIQAAASIIAVSSSYSRGVFRSCWSAILQGHSFAGGKKRAGQFVTRCWRRDTSSTCTRTLLYTRTLIYLYISVRKYAMAAVTTAKARLAIALISRNSNKSEGFRCRVNAEYIAPFKDTRHSCARRPEICLETPRGVSCGGGYHLLIITRCPQETRELNI